MPESVSARLDRPAIPRTGILGGGQLARMLVESAHRLGLACAVLADSANAPAAQLLPSAIVPIDGDRARALIELFGRAETIVFENEFVDCDELARAAHAASERTGRAPRFVPELSVLRELQDKLAQKDRLKQLRIPTSEFAPAPVGVPAGTLRSWIEEMLVKWDSGAVFKWARLGYDGKGVRIEPRPKGRAVQAARERVEEFIARASEKGVAVFAERRVRFRRELAMVAAYSISGELATWPLVVSTQENGICRLVRGPARALGVSARLERQAQAACAKLARAIRLHGCFALEFFEDESGGLIVNEIAPRVHNTGHYTQDAAETSQFENHWRAVLGLPLGKTATAPAFAMLNILGAGADLSALPQPGPRSHLHWYGKTGGTSGRKLGHLNGQVGSVRELASLVKELENCRRRWESCLK